MSLFSSSSASGHSRIPPRLVVALVIFSLASGASVALLPSIAAASGNAGQPTLAQLALTGVALIGLTTLLLAYAGRVIGLSKAWLLLALTYNSMIIIIKFVLSPSSLYGQTYVVGGGLNFFGYDPNVPLTYAMAAAIVLLLYLVVFRIMYGVFKRRSQAALGSKATSAAKKQVGLGYKVALGVVLLIAAGATGLLFIPLVFALPAFSYLTYAFAGLGAAIPVVLAVAIFTAIEAFSQAERSSLQMRDGAALATFFWLGMSLILVYHILWVIYMTVMLSIWPFKTVVPASGK